MPREQAPYAVLDCPGSKLVTRQFRHQDARCAFHHPGLGRTVEVRVDPNGRFTVQVGPAPGIGGEFETVHEGHLLTIEE